MKFLYFQDTHIRGKNSEHRLGDYYSDVMTKFKEILSTAKELKVNRIIHGGDLYESDTVSNIMVDDFMDEVEKNNIELNILPGNHDEIGHNWNLSKSTSLAHIFRRSKLIKILDYIDIKDANIYIQSFKYFHAIEFDIRDNGLFCDNKTAQQKIAVVHALVTLKPLPYQCLHIAVNDIKTDFDLVLVAHNHHPFDITVNNTRFINVGCIGRRKIDEKDIKPSILFIDTDTQELRTIPLKSAKPGNKVFDLAKIKKTKMFEGEINNFISSLQNAKIEGIDIRGKIEGIGKQKNIDKNVITECITRIGNYENKGE